MSDIPLPPDIRDMSRAEVVFSDHAIERFQERCRPALSAPAAGAELARVAVLGQITSAAPSWHACRAGETAEAYLLLGEDVVLPLVRIGDALWLAKTCLTRGTMSDAARTRRNNRKARFRAARHTRQTRPRPRPREYETVA